MKKILIVLVVFLGVILVFFKLFFSFDRISGNSMNNSLVNNEIVLLTKNPNIHRYSIIAFQKGKVSYIKRIIGMPGDSYILQGNRLSIALGQDNSMNINLQAQVAKNLRGKTKFSQGEYFVLGDNFNVSRDSRTFGTVKKSEIKGSLIVGFRK